MNTKEIENEVSIVIESLKDEGIDTHRKAFCFMQCLQKYFDGMSVEQVAAFRTEFIGEESHEDFDAKVRLMSNELGHIGHVLKDRHPERLQNIGWALDDAMWRIVRITEIKS